MSRGQFATVAVALAVGTIPAAAQPTRDDFHHLGEINKASIVMLSEVGLVPGPMASTIAAGIAAVVAEQADPGAPRSSDYLDFEARLVEVAGRDASRLHTGRSRQDIGSTFRRLAIRAALLDAYEALLAPRDALLDLAARHDATIIPAYTHGVQAQPTSLAHYLQAFAAALDRDAERLEEVFARADGGGPAWPRRPSGGRSGAHARSRQRADGREPPLAARHARTPDRSAVRAPVRLRRAGGCDPLTEAVNPPEPRDAAMKFLVRLPVDVLAHIAELTIEAIPRQRGHVRPVRRFLSASGQLDLCKENRKRSMRVPENRGALTRWAQYAQAPYRS